jgi:hypothetical protein
MIFKIIALIDRINADSSDAPTNRRLAQRIEVPGFIIGIAVRLPTEMQRQKIDYPGDHHWQRQMAPQEQEHQREDAQQDYVERQDIEVLGLILPQQR